MWNILVCFMFFCYVLHNILIFGGITCIYIYISGISGIPWNALCCLYKLENYVSHDKKYKLHKAFHSIPHIPHTHIYSYVKHNKNIKHKSAQNIPHIPDIYRHIVPHEAVVSHSVLFFFPSKNVFPCMLTSPFAR